MFNPRHERNDNPIRLGQQDAKSCWTSVQLAQLFSIIVAIEGTAADRGSQAF